MEVQPELFHTNHESLARVSDAQDIGDHYEIPPPEPSSSFASLKDRIRHHYEVCSDYYYSLWYVSPERL